MDRTSPADVVLTPIGEPARRQLRVDTRHPVPLGHPVGHVPGTVLREATRQGAAAAPGRGSLIPLRMSNEFNRYAELVTPCYVETRRPDRHRGDAVGSALVTGWQDGETVFGPTGTAGRVSRGRAGRMPTDGGPPRP